MITREEREALLTAVIQEHFNKKLNVEVVRVVQLSTSKILQDYKMSLLFNAPINTDQNPVVFHIAALGEELVGNLMLVFDNVIKEEKNNT